MKTKMKFVDASELQTNVANTLDVSQENDVVITLEGKPKAILRGVSEEEFVDYLICNSPGLIDGSDLDDWQEFLDANPWANKGLAKARVEIMQNPGISINGLLAKRKQDRGDYSRHRLWLQLD